MLARAIVADQRMAKIICIIMILRQVERRTVRTPAPASRLPFAGLQGIEASMATTAQDRDLQQSGRVQPAPGERIGLIVAASLATDPRQA
jgi:hypothetical protein